MRKLITCAAAAAMVTGSSVAQAAPVAVNDARIGAEVGATESLGGSEIWLGLLAAGLLIFVLFQINDSDEDDLPHSP